jgi:hypothetical protein
MNVPLPRQGPTTHVTQLVAAGHAIQYVNAFELKNALQASTDLRHDLGDTMDEHFPILLDRKMEDCTDWFVNNLATRGIQEPLIVIIEPCGSWTMNEGHHRLAWALLHDLDVPVFFDESGCDDSNASYMLSRYGIVATHSSTTEEFITGAGEQLAEETDEFLSMRVSLDGDEVNLIPTPRNGGRHRDGGRHRAHKA